MLNHVKPEQAGPEQRQKQLWDPFKAGQLASFVSYGTALASDSKVRMSAWHHVAVLGVGP